MDRKEIWSHIKTLRLEYLKKKGNIKCEATHVEDKNSFIAENEMKHNLEKLSHLVQVNSFNQSINLSKSDINLGAEMFVALNSCPSHYVKLYWNVIYGPKSRIALLASKIMKKAKNEFQKHAQKIFSKIFPVLGFQHISYYQADNDTWVKNIIDIKGRCFSIKIFGKGHQPLVHDIINTQNCIFPTPSCYFKLAA